MNEILSIAQWPTNGHLIADCATLGYLREEWSTLDPTYGYGIFWCVWQPNNLTGCDINRSKSPVGRSIDFRDLPWANQQFVASVFDPPYKLNGTPTDTGGIDERFGTEQYTSWQDRIALILDGVKEVARVTELNLLVKCQDQVVSGKIRWQTRLIEDAIKRDFGLRDRFDFWSYRPQPEGRSQKTARRCASQLLVFQRGWKS